MSDEAVATALSELSLEAYRATSLATPAPALPASAFLRPGSSRPRPGEQVRGARALQREASLPPPGTVIDKYRLERVLGIGGFGVVYRARHVVLETVVAIKLIRPSVVEAQPSMARMLSEEARFAAQLEHGNVVRVFDIVTADELSCIVMEYVDGPDLSLMIKRRGALPPKMVARVIRHVAAALEAGLAKGLVHRDVKPSNILLTRGGVTKLTDFGLALSATGGGARGVVGTAGYMSPEQLDQPGEVDFRSDIYALGVTAYHALAGQLPFPARDPRASADAHRYQAATPVHHVVPTVPTALSNLVMWMLAKRREHRPQGYRELLAAVAGG